MPHGPTATCPRCGAPVAGAERLEGLCPACLMREGLGQPPARGARPGEPGGDGGLEQVRRWFPQLEIERLVGRGGMGLVYRARQPRLERTVALKVLVPELAHRVDFAERFLREARAMARLQHQNIVAVHDFGEVDGRWYLVMEFVEGRNLRTLLERGPLEPARVLELAAGLCDGLAYAHARGIVHRDVKPENVLLDGRGRPKLADFGLVKVLDGDDLGPRTRTSQVMGTLHYMAPEQMNRPLEVDHRADVYSLGVLLYELLTGEVPFGRFPAPSERTALDPRLDAIVLRALEHDPDRRFQEVGELAAALAAIGTGPARRPRREEAPAHPTPEPPAPEPPATEPDWPVGRRLPFSNKDRLEGLLELHGLVGLEGDELVLEYRTSVWGMRTSGKVTQLRIDARDLSAARLVTGWFRCQLRLWPRRLAALDGLPTGPEGTTRLHFARRDRELAARLAEALGRRIEAAEAGV